MSQPPTKVQSGPSADALAAFYRQRSESLRRNTTTTEDQAMNQQQKQADTPVQADTRGWFQRLYDALGGH